jgi:hypothetical protein
MKPKSARMLLGAALIVYLLWIAALASLVVVSGSQPAEGKRLAAPARSSSVASPEPEPAKD